MYGPKFKNNYIAIGNFSLAACLFIVRAMLRVHFVSCPCSCLLLLVPLFSDVQNRKKEKNRHDSSEPTKIVLSKLLLYWKIWCAIVPKEPIYCMGITMDCLMCFFIMLTCFVHFQFQLLWIIRIVTTTKKRRKKSN